MTGITDSREMKARIIVLGVGGAGGNAVNNMIASGLQGVEFIVANTDAQALTTSRAKRIIQMGAQATQGLGAGSQPEVGRAAAEEATNALSDHLTGAHTVRPSVEWRVLGAVRTFSVADFPCFADVIRAFLGDNCESVSGHRTVLAVAGPMTEGRCVLTNCSWTIDPHALRPPSGASPARWPWCRRRQCSRRLAC
jgi:hypothetical protein